MEGCGVEIQGPGNVDGIGGFAEGCVERVSAQFLSVNGLYNFGFLDKFTMVGRSN